MHRGRHIWFLAGLLFVCLACLEVPEESTLTNDTSNDFTILVHAPTTEEAATFGQDVGCPQAAPQTSPCFTSGPARVAFSAQRPGSRDLLALYSLRRT
ncbi:MAG TPA: hypothetical protein VLY23_00970 [Candidatus Acidoferrum sp.]|nr:hypothetical protein [Candidatus Acidoferrum sp.]